MPILITLLIGTVGGAIAVLLKLPVPWLIGSLLAVVFCRKFSFITPPP